MYSKILFFVLLASIALVHGIAIGKDSALAEAKSVVTPHNSIKIDPAKGVTVQGGYEGYITSPQKTDGNSISKKINWLTSSKINFVRSLTVPITRFLVAYKAKITYIAVHALLALALGTIAAIAVCSFTSVCSFSVADKLFKGQTVKEKMDEIKNTFVNNEYFEMAKNTLLDAIEFGAVKPQEVEQPNQHLDEQNATE